MKLSILASILLVVTVTVSVAPNVDAHSGLNTYKLGGFFKSQFGGAGGEHVMTPVESILTYPATFVHYFTHQPVATSGHDHDQSAKHDEIHGIEQTKSSHTPDVSVNRCECAQNDWNNELTDNIIESVKSAEELDEALSQAQMKSKVAHSPEIVDFASVEAVEGEHSGTHRDGRSETGSSVEPEFAAADRDLRQVHDDLDRIIENLDKTNHRVHSALFKTLRAYVLSIQKRIDHQNKGKDRVAGIATKIVALKTRLAEAVLKLKLKLTLKPLQTFIGKPSLGPLIHASSAPGSVHQSDILATQQELEARSDPIVVKSTKETTAVHEH